MKMLEQTCRFEKMFGSNPAIYRAPGRVNLIGEHTDYNDGFVLPLAIQFSTQVAITPRTDRKLMMRSEEFKDEFEFDLERLPANRTGSWCDYIVGVATILNQHGHRLNGANLLVGSNVPIGAGLSSSAAIEVASALALLDLADIPLDKPEIAKICRQAENEFVGARVGIMDQFVSCMGKAGHAFFLDCRSLEFKLVPIPADVRFVVCNTMVKHELAKGSYNVRRQECEEGVRVFSKLDPRIHALRDVSIDLLEQHANDLPENIRKRCSHVVHENQRVLDAVECLKGGDLVHLGKVMRESHQSLRDLYEVSCSELDVMVESAEGLPGYFGGRMTGGGFGGCTVNLVRAKDAQNFTVQIAERYEQATKIHPQIYICSAHDGAQKMS